jgi:hypothetical protein
LNFFATISSFGLIDFMFLVVLSKQNSSFPFANKISSFDLIDFMFLVVLSEQNSSLPFANKISSFDWIDLFLVVVETNGKLFATMSSFLQRFQALI